MLNPENEYLPQRYFAVRLSPASSPLLPPSSKWFLSEPRASEHGRGWRRSLTCSEELRAGPGSVGFWDAGRSWSLGRWEPGRKPGATTPAGACSSRGCQGGGAGADLAGQLPAHQKKHQRQPAEIIALRGFEVWRKSKTKGNGRQALLEHEKANKPRGFSDLFFLGSFKRAFAVAGNKFLEMRRCYYS